ncbi:hypothetical protein PG993_014984 [Apiospora rasikravindrae]|uniref:Zn(2)-C6 fungal-type domain-containing protein n=1 Tax=Apiospora rasikravindrae TaxID=990691 RepID=A0ABR1RPD1_9PEZI
MAPGRKRGGGCWTCRLRRKLCDSIRPVCGSCQSLDIPCHTGESKPVWMKGSARQQRMTETAKQTVKQNALLRKEWRLLTHEHQNIVVTTTRDFEAPRVPFVPQRCREVRTKWAMP